MLNPIADPVVDIMYKGYRRKLTEMFCIFKKKTNKSEKSDLNFKILSSKKLIAYFIKERIVKY